jgi:ADP-ribose pyrophosphatase YjhB (NUDIX family)
LGAHLGGLGGVTEGRVSAGCGAAIVSNGHILLVKRRRPPERGCWNLPGGKVDHLERIEDAIRREILEETGLAIRLTRFLQLTQMLGQDGEHRLSPVWLAEVVKGEARNLEPERAEAITWFALSRPPAPLGQAAGEAIGLLAYAGTGLEETDAR